MVIYFIVDEQNCNDVVPRYAFVTKLLFPERLQLYSSGLFIRQIYELCDVTIFDMMIYRLVSYFSKIFSTITGAYMGSHFEPRI